MAGIVRAAESYVLPKSWNCQAGDFTSMSWYDEKMHLHCLACPKGKYQDKRGQQPCKYCPRGQLSIKSRKGCWKSEGGARDSGRCGRQPFLANH